MSSIMQYNGAAVIAMAGKNCVGIASDRRYGLRNQTISCDMKKTFQVNDKTLCGLTGLATDMQTLEQKFTFRSNMYKLREERDMSPTVFSNMVSSLLYEKRFGPYFCEPVICGLEGEENKPYLCGMDLLGAQVYTDDFILAGDCPEAMYGLCESLYKPDLDADAPLRGARAVPALRRRPRLPRGLGLHRACAHAAGRHYAPAQGPHGLRGRGARGSLFLVGRTGLLLRLARRALRHHVCSARHDRRM